MFKKLALFLVLPFMLTGCQFGCDAEKVISEKLASGMAKVGDCSHPEEIQKDVLAVIDVAKFCAANGYHDERCKEFPMDAVQGPIANFVCPLAVGAFVSIVGTVVPVRYGCKLVGSPLNALVLTACQQLPF